MSLPQKNPLNILLTGIPRSGTTLTCNLLDSLDNTFALVEPLDMQQLLSCPTKDDRHQYIQEYFHKLRIDITQNKVITRKQSSGSSTNTFADNLLQNNKRVLKPTTVTTQNIDKNLSGDLAIIIKHPNAFTALLGELVMVFNCFAIIRNPISVLSSWNSLDHPLNKGHAPMAEAFDHNLKQKLSKISFPLKRQLALLDWYYQQFHQFLSTHQVIRYEDIINSNGAVLSAINNGAKTLKTSLSNKNKNSLYNKEFTEEAKELLLKQEAHGCWLYYTFEDINHA